MATYNWDLIERLLHEVQNGAYKPFKPREYAAEFAADQTAEGVQLDKLDSLKVEASEYEALLLKEGFIEPRPEHEGGNGENFVLTLRGSSLLSLLDSSIPGSEHPREVLDEKGEAALQPEVFDEIAKQAAIA